MMETSKLKKFAQYARRYLIEQVSAKLKFVLASESAARRENPKAVQELEKQIQATSQDRVIEKVAYIWFNRFCALRFMDANRYTSIGIVSPAEGQFQPEILADAKMGHIDEAMVPDKTRQQVFALLGGSAPSRDPQQEAYSLLLVAVCNYYNPIMPFMFEKIADYTELLMPDDLLSGNSILAYTREAMTQDVCRDVEVIGWLYQFYISEKKDEVFEGLKKNRKITPENIPAATQLFTPHWIVRYLVENSLGRLWMLNRPNSRLIERMDYYIKPEQPETDFLKISRPEEIKLCDPASGSGHMLTYSFDLLYAIYEEEGYDTNEIPRLILENNLFGIEIDERAGELAAFALTMKARDKYKRFLIKPVQPNICVLQNIHFEEGELERYMDAVGRDLFTANLQTMLQQFREVDNFGSLVRPEYADATEILRIVEQKKLTSDLFLRNTHERVLLALKQADYLSPKYHVVVANPPYMGGKGMNDRLKAFLQGNYTDVKSDLFSAFIVRNTELALPKGQLGFMSPFVWMFISSYEKLREFLINHKSITSLVQLEYSGFDGATVPICTFTVDNAHHPDFKGGYVRLSDFRGAENQAPKTRAAIKNIECGWFYRASAADFKKIPGSPIAYWLPRTAIKALDQTTPLDSIAEPRKGMCTRDNDYFVRTWQEVSINNIGFGCKSRQESVSSSKRWFPYQKGGDFRQWFGNHHSIVDWGNDGYKLLHMEKLGWKGNSTNHNLDYIFLPAILWSKITSAFPSFRYSPEGFLFDDASGLCYVNDQNNIQTILAFLCCKVGRFYMNVINPTLNIQPGNMASMPLLAVNINKTVIDKLINNSKKDWDSYETSWDFTNLPIFQTYNSQLTLKETYTKLRTHWREITLEMQHLEEENNRIFIEAYGLQDELRPDVPLSEITLTCNPHYLYGGDKSEEELEVLLLADTMKEFISYTVGCMFGRYSLDAPGLILANQGETVADYKNKVETCKKQNDKAVTDHVPLATDHLSFEPDEDNVIPILDEGWFIDDIADRFSKFLNVTFGEEHYEENLTFIEDAIGKDIRKYFLKDFYADHLKRYKKRPIYWLFSSPKGSFNAMIYMHRYRPDTVSIVLNEYLREFRTKLSARKDNLEQISISASASAREKTQALKDIEKLRKMIDELEEYEREIMYPLATKQISIDLDDGVKVNYLKFGEALKKIPGLETKEED